MAGFFCRLVKDCATNDGIREYVFSRTLDDFFQDCLAQFGAFQSIEHNGRVIFRLHRPDYYKIHFSRDNTKALVFFENDLYPEARAELEEAFRLFSENGGNKNANRQ